MVTVSHKSAKGAQTRSSQTREKLLDAAAAILERDGLAQLNTNALALEAGVTVPTVYRNFKNKEDVLVGLAHAFIEVERSLLEHVLDDFAAAPDLHSAIDLVIDSYWRSASEHRGIVPLRAAMRVWPELRDVEEESLLHSTQWLADALCKREPQLASRDARRVGRYLVETVCATVDRCYPLKRSEQRWRIASLKEMVAAYLKAVF